MPSNAKTSFFSSSPEELAVSTNSSDIEKSYSISIHTPLKDLINNISSIQSSTSEEYNALFKPFGPCIGAITM